MRVYTSIKLFLMIFLMMFTVGIKAEEIGQQKFPTFNFSKPSKLFIKKIRPNINLPPVNGKILDWYCDELNSPKRCLAAGYNKKKKTRIPVFFESKNGDTDWKEIKPADYVSEGYWHSVRCNLDNSLCIAVGLTPIKGKLQMIAKSVQQGAWTIQYFNLMGWVSGYKLDLARSCCTGDKNNSLCVLTSSNTENFDVIPFIFSKDLGSHWISIDQTGKNTFLYCDFDGTYSRVWSQNEFWDTTSGNTFCGITYTLDNGNYWTSDAC